MTSTSPLRLHRRQFVIGPRAYRGAEDWVSVSLHPGRVLSHCPDLRVASTRDASGRAWALLGGAVQSEDSRPDPTADIARTVTESVPDLCESWVGRWVLVGEAVYLDAAGLLGCFYGTDPTGERWASSSPALLSKILFPDDAPETDARVLRYEIGISWFGPPLSRFTGMHRLLPSQALVLHDGSLQARRFLPAIQPDRSIEETYGLLANALEVTMRRATLQPPVWLALSAGGDSRLILAVAHRAGLQVRPYTRLVARMKLADRLLPPRLCAELGYPHEYFRVRSRSELPGRRALVREHGARHVAEEDVLPILDGSRDDLRGVSMGGNCFGVGKAPGRKYLPDRVDDLESAAEAIARGIGEPRNSRAVAGLRQWLLWCRDHPVPHLDWRDRFYIEQRLAGWLSSKEQIYDMTSHDRFVPINSARNYALLLSLPEARRRMPGHLVEVIRRVAPELTRHPLNPPDRYFGILPALLARARHPVQVVKRLGQKLGRAWNLTRARLDRRPARDS